MGDLDGDARPDLVSADKRGVEVLLRREDGWSSRRIAELEGEGLALADVDRDGRTDLLYSNGWLAAPAEPDTGEWTRHVIAPRWPAATRIARGDLNGDGRLDVVLTASESKGGLSWFEAPEDPRARSWREHPIDTGPLEQTHSLQLADLDADGLEDVVVAEMRGTPESRISFYARDARGRWSRDVVSHRGSHNLLAVDLDHDGDVDLIGKNSDGAETPVEWWRNRSGDRLSLDRWRYRAIDRERPPSEREKMGLFVADLDGDALPEVIAGSRVYSLAMRSDPLRPSCPPRLGASWHADSLGEVDLLGAADVDGDAAPDLVGMRGDELFWLEAGEGGWRTRRVATIPEGRTQGFATGDVVAGGRSEIVFTRGKALHMTEIPEDPDGPSPWRVTTLATDSEEEGVALGDLDRDGDLDVATHAADGHEVLWYENPARAGAAWLRHSLFRSTQWLDRIAIADLDRDGRLDVAFSQESPDWEPNSGVFWLAAPADPVAGAWQAHEIIRLRSVNSLSVGDMDGDGDPDLVVAEHTDQVREAGALDNQTLVLENRDEARHWEAHVVERGGHSSHLGAKLGDLDGDGDLDIVSFGWMQYRPIHLWENLAVSPAACRGRRD